MKKQIFITTIILAFSLLSVSACSRPPLQNAIEWGLSADTALDDVLFSVGNPVNEITKTIMYPGRWPSEYFNGAIPEYFGSGYLYKLIITAWDARDLEPGKAGTVSLTIYGFDARDVDNYIESLIREGFLETHQDDYLEDAKYELANDHFQSFRMFTTDDVTVRLITSQGEAGEFLQIAVTMNDLKHGERCLIGTEL